MLTRRGGGLVDAALTMTLIAFGKQPPLPRAGRDVTALNAVMIVEYRTERPANGS